MNKLFAVSCLILNSLVAAPAFAEEQPEDEPKATCYRLIFQRDGGKAAFTNGSKTYQVTGKIIESDYFRYSGDEPQRDAFTQFRLSATERKTARVEPAVSQGAQQCEVAPSIPSMGG